MTSPALWLEPVTAAKRDTIVRVRVCLALPAAQKVGSFHLEVEYDSLIVRATAASAAPGGTQVANTLVAGRVAIAGAAPSGFVRGTVNTISFRRRGTALGTLQLSLRELNGVDGTSLVMHTTVHGIGAPRATPALARDAAPALDKLAPARTTIVPGGVAEVMIHGRGFTSEGNVVMFGPAVLGELRSSDGVTLRLLVPNSWPSSGEAPPRLIEAGEYAVQIRNTRGVSNALLLTLVNP